MDLNLTNNTDAEIFRKIVNFCSLMARARHANSQGRRIAFMDLSWRAAKRLNEMPEWAQEIALRSDAAVQ